MIEKIVQTANRENFGEFAPMSIHINDDVLFGKVWNKEMLSNTNISANIRRANKKDIPRIAEIIIFGKRVAYRSIFQNDYVSFNEMQVVDLYEYYISNLDTLVNMYLYDDGIVKGVINERFEDEKVIEITDFYVEPFFVGQGIGTLMIKHTIWQARKKGIQKIILWVIKDNVRTRKFYEINGFVYSGKTRIIDGTMKEDFCYEYVFE